MPKVLVTVFSATGTTLRKGEEIAIALHAPLFPLEPQISYTRADLNWNDPQSRSSLECNDPKSRPPLKVLPDISAYDVIFLGFPIWWFCEPKLIDTFVESVDLSGKTVILFATSGGSGLVKAVRQIEALAPGARVLQGQVLNGRDGGAWALKMMEKL